MSVDRPTFSESWYRTSNLRPRLRAAVHSYRQQFRGRMWHVLADSANNQHFRLDEPAYHFVGLLDGRRTVAEVWQVCNEHLGDHAPTQGEVIQLLGQLYTSNLLQGDLPPDAQQMFEMHRKRRNREVRSYLMNFLFVRIPLLDPNRMLQRWVGLIGWIFGPVGIALWLILLGAAGYFLVGRFGELWRSADPQVLLQADNVLLLYGCFAAVKALHELGHGFACARFGRSEGVGGPVHTIGIMLLVFMPVPYVDASSSWAFRSKWRRAFVGAAGMYVELAIAAVAAIVWTHTVEGTTLHAIAYNVIFIASISTLLFNGNPLLRFDGYYILSDLLEMPNLVQRSKQHLYYLVRRYVYGVRRIQSPAHGGTERGWLFFYGVTSTVYRVLICVGILLYVADMLFILGVLMAVAAVVTWVLVPTGKFVKYLGTSQELVRVRGRAVGVTFFILAALVIPLATVPAPDRGRAEGVVEPVRMAVVYTAADGFVDSALVSGRRIDPTGPPLLNAHNRELEAEREQLLARLRIVDLRREVARGEDTAVAQALTEQRAAIRQRLDRVERQLASLELHTPFKGVWVSREAPRLEGVHLERGRRVGLVADPEDLIVRAIADQALGPRIEPEIGIGDHTVVEMRVKGRPGIALTGTILGVLPAGHRQLPSAALGYLAGGSVAMEVDEEGNPQAVEPFFEVRIRPNLDIGEHPPTGAPPLRIGQRVVVRFSMPDKPLIAQWWRWLRQTVQGRFSIPL